MSAVGKAEIKKPTKQTNTQNLRVKICPLSIFIVAFEYSWVFKEQTQGQVLLCAPKIPWQ